MGYTKTNWQNGGTPAINATNLNKIEQGIYDAQDPTKILTALKTIGLDADKLNGIESSEFAQLTDSFMSNAKGISLSDKKFQEGYIGYFVWNNDISNQKIDLYLDPTVGANHQSGTIELTLVSSFTNSNNTGTLTKRIHFNGTQAGVINALSAEYTTVSPYMADKVAISNPKWDSTLSKWKITIACLDGKANGITILGKTYNYSGMDMGRWSLSAIYTTDTEVYSNPAVPFLRSDTTSFLVNASGIKGGGTGIANTAYFVFNDANGTRQGYIGKGSSISNNIQVQNDITDGNISLITKGTGIVQINGYTAWHSGNFPAQIDAYTVNIGNSSVNKLYVGKCAQIETSNVRLGQGVNTTATASSSILIGNETGYNLTSVSGSIALGQDCARITTGSANVTSFTNCTYVGNNCRPSAASGNTNEIVIGYNAPGYGSNKAHIGNSSIDSISFGAGTGTAFTNRSDRRIKEDIQDANLDMCYNDIKNLPLHRFKYKDYVGNEGDQHLTGFIADEFELTFPKAVFKNDHSFPVLDAEGNKVMKTIVETDTEGNEVTREVEETFVIEGCASIDTSQIVPTLLGAVQKLMGKVEALEAEIAALKS